MTLAQNSKVQKFDYRYLQEEFHTSVPLENNSQKYDRDLAWQ